MWRAAQHSLHLGSEIGGIKLGRPRGRARQEIYPRLFADMGSKMSSVNVYLKKCDLYHSFCYFLIVVAKHQVLASLATTS